ncbi:MAG: YegP family protein [Saprospiraceae bacterium]
MKFELFQSEKNEKFYFRLVAGNGQIIMSSQAYATKAAAKNGIASVGENATTEGRFDRKVASNGKNYFSLKSGNGQIVGDSQMYASADGMENGIKSVMEHAPIAPTVDKTAAE